MGMEAGGQPDKEPVPEQHRDEEWVTVHQSGTRTPIVLDPITTPIYNSFDVLNNGNEEHPPEVRHQPCGETVGNGIPTIPHG